MSVPWPPALEDGESIVEQGRPSVKRRLKETLFVAVIVVALHAAIELYQDSFDWGDLAVFLAVFLVVYSLFNIFFRKGDDWVLTDQRFMLRRGSTIRRDDVASVTANNNTLILKSSRNATWKVEPLADPAATAARLNWGAQ